MKKVMIVLLSIVCLLAWAQAGQCDFNWEWINKDHKNTTTHPRNDVTWIMAGHIKNAIVTTYNNGFNAPTIIETTDTQGRKWTFIKWPVRTTPINDGDKIHVGLLIDRDKWPAPGELVGFWNAYWTQDGNQKEFVSGCAGIGEWASAETLHVVARAPMDTLITGVTLTDFAYAIVDSPFALPSLTFDNPAIPWSYLPGSLDIFEDSIVELAQITEFEFDQYLVFQASVRFIGDDPSSAGHIIYQRQITQTAIPTLTEWGLIIFAVLLLAFITWVLLRRKKYLKMEF
jgi:hypothetical protein